jgi:hypothetical protein
LFFYFFIFSSPPGTPEMGATGCGGDFVATIRAELPASVEKSGGFPF